MPLRQWHPTYSDPQAVIPLVSVQLGLPLIPWVNGTKCVVWVLKLGLLTISLSSIPISIPTLYFEPWYKSSKQAHTPSSLPWLRINITNKHTIQHTHGEPFHSNGISPCSPELHHFDHQHLPHTGKIFPHPFIPLHRYKSPLNTEVCCTVRAVLEPHMGTCNER